MARLLGLLALVALTVGCGDGTNCPAAAPAPNGPELEPVWTTGKDQLLHPLSDGDTIPVEPPPQGGYVLFVAAKVRGLLGCVEIAGSLIDPTTGNEAGFDARTATLQAGADGWSAPAADKVSDFSNVNACPNYGSREMIGVPWTLKVRVTETGGPKRKLEATRTVTLACTSDQGASVAADCACTCAANYCLGKCQDVVDGGAPRNCSN